MGHEFIPTKKYSDMNKKELRAEIDRLSSRLVEVKSELEMTKGLYNHAKLSLSTEQDSCKKLIDVLKDFQPKEVQDELNTCQRGEWCNACAYHQTVNVRHNIRSGQFIDIKNEYVDVCMKGLACKSFLNKSERED